MIDDLPRLFDYDDWANRRVGQSLWSVPTLGERTRQVFAHIHAAARVWRLRIEGRDWTVQPIWPDISIDAAESLREENAAAYPVLLGESGGAGPGRVVTYKDSRGEAHATALEDILRQVLLHGCYHRGQLAVAIRTEGGSPANTDYITYARERGPTA